MEAKKDENNFTIILNGDETLVLFEWLTRFNQKQDHFRFEDQAEERILYDLEAELEKIIPEIFKSNYLEILSKARKNIKDTG